MAKQGRAESALDAVFEILEEVKELRKEVSILDANLKLANNKIAKLQKSLQASITDASIPKISNPAISSNPAEVIDKSGKQGEWIGGKIRTYGRIVNRNKKPIVDVLVKIYNEKGDVIKTRQTDYEGYWEVRLPSGKYGVEYIHKGFKNINLVIELDDSMNSFEVK